MISISSDIDWAPDYMIDNMLEIFDKYSIKATFFCTHKINIPKHELGIHPNFLPDSTHGKTPLEILTHMKKIIPNAKGVRAHNLFNYSTLFSHYKKFGIEYDSSIIIPLRDTQPYMKFPGILEIPMSFEDDLYFLNNKKTFKIHETKIVKNKNFVFNFHPIHIFLNTNSITKFQKAKPHLYDEKSIKKYVNSKIGIKDLLIELLDLITKKDIQVVTLKQFNNDIRKLQKNETKKYC